MLLWFNKVTTFKSGIETLKSTTISNTYHIVTYSCDTWKTYSLEKHKLRIFEK